MNVMGMFVYDMSKKNDLMFWGGNVREKINTQTRSRCRDTRLDVEASSAASPSGRRIRKEQLPSPLLDCRIRNSGPRAQWGMVHARGRGPVYRTMKSMGFVSLFMTKWMRLYVCLTEDRLLFFQKRSVLTPLASVHLNSVLSLQCFVGENLLLRLLDGEGSGSSSSVLADTVDVVLQTAQNDEIHIR